MYQPDNGTEYRPTGEQLARARALQRYNRLNIYVPVAVVVIIVVVLFVLMLVGIFAPGLVGAEAFLSALADTILVLWMIPTMVFLALVPIGYVAYRVNRRQRRAQLPPDSLQLEYGRVQPLLWRVQELVGRVSVTADSLSQRIVRPMIRINGRAAGLFTWLEMLTSPIWRNDNNDPNESN